MSSYLNIISKSNKSNLIESYSIQLYISKKVIPYFHPLFQEILIKINFEQQEQVNR